MAAANALTGRRAPPLDADLEGELDAHRRARRELFERRREQSRWLRRLVERLAAADYSRRAMATALGVSYATIQAIMRANRPKPGEPANDNARQLTLPHTQEDRGLPVGSAARDTPTSEDP